MAKLAQLIEGTARTSGLPLGTVNLAARHLREAGLIASGGRGPGGAEMSYRDAANLLIGVASAMTVKDAPFIVRMVSSARVQGVQSGHNDPDIECPLAIPNFSELDFGSAVEGLLRLIGETGEPLNRFTDEPVISFFVEIGRVSYDFGAWPTLVVREMYDDIETEFRFEYFARSPDYDREKIRAARRIRFGGGINISARIDDGVFYVLAYLIAGRHLDLSDDDAAPAT